MGVFAAVHRVTLPRGLLCKSLYAKWRSSDIRDGVGMVMAMRIRGDCCADKAREATSLGSVKDVWSLLFSLRSFGYVRKRSVSTLHATRIKIILEVCDSL